MLVALVAILSVYLLPFLVGRREVMRMSNADDRYSSELRVLATGDALTSDEACSSSGHAQIFRRRPEVKAMNRPAVRNVRALRTERELTRARRAHGEARERRRVAASHRARVAGILTGVLLGTVAVCRLTTLPWLIVAVPAFLLCVSMGAGRRAARESVTLDRRERQRITDLERELTDLTGERPAVPGSAEAETDGAAPWAVRRETRGAAPWSAEPAGATGWRAAAASNAAPAARTTSGSEAVEAVQEAASNAVDERGRRRSAPMTAVGAGETASPAGESVERRARAAASAAEAAGPVSSVDGAHAAGEGGEESDDGRASEPIEESSAAAAHRPAGQENRSGRRMRDETVQHSLMTVAWPVTEVEVESDAGASSPSHDRPAAGGSTASEREATAPATPPQGWRPVHVPAPTYTLAARAPRRSYDELEQEPHPSAPVPSRPRNVRSLPTEGVEREEIEFHPIDLDAVLEKRRTAAGA